MSRVARFTVFGAPLAWLFHLLAAYAIAEFGCLGGWHQMHLGHLTAVTAGLVAVTLLALAVALAGCFSAWRTWHHLASGPQGADRFLAKVGLWAGVLFTVVILAQAVPVGYYWHGC